MERDSQSVGIQASNYADFSVLDKNLTINFDLKVFITSSTHKCQVIVEVMSKTNVY